MMIPVGGNFTINSEEAARIIGEIEPKIVVPMHYKIPCLTLDLHGVEKFTQKVKAKAEKSDVIKIKEGALPQETNVYILKPHC